MENLKDNQDIQDATKEVIEKKTGIEKLHTYKQAGLELASQLRIITKGMKALGRNNAEKQCGELMVKLAEDRFILAVLGQFKRGKSSLMNAIIGENILPTGVLPLTSVITILKYGPAERLLVNHNHSILPNELPVSALPDYVTEKYNPNNAKKVKDVYLELPVPFLQSGVEFVDTPGVGSTFTNNSETTYGFLPECDAVLFVTSADMPMTSLELGFLHQIRGYVSRIFFVVNKIDLVSDGERREVLGFVTETIKGETGHEEVKLFPVSSRLGLDARISGDETLYEKSGLKALEDALASFLSTEKEVSFLAAVAQKILRILDTEVSDGIFEEATLKARAQAIKEEKPVTHHTDPNVAARALQESHAKLGVLYNALVNHRMPEIMNTEIQSVNETESIAGDVAAGGDGQPENGSVSEIQQAEIHADLKTNGCPVCTHMASQAFDFFAHWQYQLSAKEHAQREFAAELGFCPLHTWQLLSISSPYGVSVGYGKLFEQLAYRLRREKIQILPGNAVSDLIRDFHNCRVCKILRRVEKEYVRRLTEIIAAPDGSSLYRHSQGACVRHIGMIIDIAPSPEISKLVLLHAAERFEQDTEDMRSYAIKRDALRRGLLNKDEKEAYLRSIIRFVGDRSVSMPWPQDGEI